jgi:hypothetical protein
MRIEREDGSKCDVSIGDSIQLEPPKDQLPFLARVTDMYKVDDTDAKFITTQWYCRKSEIPSKHKALIPWDTRQTEGQTEEVFMSGLKPEVNPVESVIARVEIHHLMDGAPVPDDISPNAFYCRYKYLNSKTGSKKEQPFRPLKKEDLPNMIQVVIERFCNMPFL